MTEKLTITSALQRLDQVAQGAREAAAANPQPVLENGTQWVPPTPEERVIWRNTYGKDIRYLGQYNHQS